jgi:hypothetical protein
MERRSEVAVHRKLSNYFASTWLPLFLSGNLLIFGTGLLLGANEERRQWGLGMWLLGAFTVLNLVVLRRDGRLTHMAQIFAAAGGIYLTIYKTVPDLVSGGVGKVLLIVVSVVLVLVAIAGWELLGPPPAAQLFQELAAEMREAARPVRPADPAAEIAKTQAIIAAHIDEFRLEQPDESARMTVLLARYRADHGTDTVETSTRPIALKNAADTLVEDFEQINERLTTRTGKPYAILALAYTRHMADIACDRTR